MLNDLLFRKQSNSKKKLAVPDLHNSPVKFSGNLAGTVPVTSTSKLHFAA